MPTTSQTGTARRVAALAFVALLAAACGDPDGTGGTQPTESAAPDVGGETEAASAPSDVPTKDPVAPPAEPSTTTTAAPPSDGPPTDAATGEPGTTASESAPPQPAQPAAPVTDLASAHAAITGAIGRTDVSAALAELGPFPADLPFPDGSVLAEVTLEETDLRVLTGDPDTIRPISNRVGGLAVTLVKIEEAQPQMDAALTAIGFEIFSSGTTATTEGDGTEARNAFYSRADGDDLSETLTLTLIARPDSDWLEVDVDLTTDQDAPGLSAPITLWVAGYPAPPGFTLQGARLSTLYIGAPSVSYTATFNGPLGQVEPAIQQVQSALPAGGFEAGTDPGVRGEPDLRIGDLLAPGIGQGETAVSESGDVTNVRPLIAAEFPLPPALEPWLVG